MPVTRCFWCGRVSAVCFSRFYLLSPVPFCSFFTPSAVYMPVARVPAVPPRASQPFPQFERAAGFTGFTLTPLTPRPRPPTATHPAAGQSCDAHVAITHRLARDWPRPATPLTLIGCVLPPARPLRISFLCFLFFFRCSQLKPVCWQRLSAPTEAPVTVHGVAADPFSAPPSALSLRQLSLAAVRSVSRNLEC